jgi:hypothetical protein
MLPEARILPAFKSQPHHDTLSCHQTPPPPAATTRQRADALLIPKTLREITRRCDRMLTVASMTRRACWMLAGWHAPL